MPLVPDYIAALRPYVPGRSAEEVRRQYGLDSVVKLASNENPLGPSPLAVEAARAALASSHRYPDGGLALRAALARQFALKVDNVVVGSGSEGLMANVIRTFLCDDDEVLTTEAAFIGFRVLAQSRGVRYRTVPYRDWRYDLPALADAINERTKLIYLANPNNPTGTTITTRELEDFHARVPERVLILLDEAYFEYAQGSPEYPDSMSYRYDNVITLRTFSKAYGLAGLRIGYGFAHDALIANLLKVKLPFEPATAAQSAALAALDDPAFLQRTLGMNARGLKRLTEGLTAMGYEVVPSRANFVMIVLPDAGVADRLTEELLHAGVIVRPLASFGLPACIRISTGTDDEITRGLEAIARLTR